MASPESGTVIDVMVCLATVTPPRLVNVQVPAQATVADAVHASGLLNGLDLTIDTCRLGVQKVRATGTREGLKWLRNEAPPKDDVLE